MDDLIAAADGALPDVAPGVTVEHLSDADGVVTMRVAGHLDISTEAIVRRELDEAVAGGPTGLVLEVSALNFMDSSGLAVLLGAAAHVTNLELRNPAQIIRRLITISGLSETLRITSDA
jgi:anti-sigma B factor antagonist